jgi:hypothetical protein
MSFLPIKENDNRDLLNRIIQDELFENEDKLADENE